MATFTVPTTAIYRTADGSDARQFIASTQIDLTEAVRFQMPGASAQAELATLGINFVIDGGGSVITAGIKGRIKVPFPARVVAWAVQGDQSGSVAVDVLRAPESAPTTYASLVGAGTKPNLTSQQASGLQVPTGWTSVVIATGDWLRFDVTGSPGSVTNATICLELAG